MSVRPSHGQFADVVTLDPVMARVIDGEAVLHLLMPLAHKAAGATTPWRGVAGLLCSLACYWPLLLARPKASVEHAAAACGWQLGAIFSHLYWFRRCSTLWQVGLRGGSLVCRLRHGLHAGIESQLLVR